MKHYIISLNMELDREFIYTSKKELTLGLRCIVPFRNSIRTGIVQSEAVSVDNSIQYKEILEVVEDKPLLTFDLWKLSFWIANYYATSIGKVLFSMLPKGLSLEIFTDIRLKGDHKELEHKLDLYDMLKDEEWHELNYIFNQLGSSISYKLIEELEKAGIIEVKRHYDKKVKVKKANFIFVEGNDKDVKLSPKQKEAFELIRSSEKILALTDIAKAFSYSIIRALQEKGLIKIIPLEVSDNIDLLPTRKERKIVTLTDEQAKVISNIEKDLESYKVHLLYGITGSGKTEVYIRIMEKVLANGKNALLLVPEISLTPQTVDRFYSAFGENIAILHSNLTDRERFHEWKRIKANECRIIIGARSAIFAPLQDIGLIIVDEEHEGSYKQENSPRYNARDLAVMRGKINVCPVILGSATPSLESWLNALNGRYILNKMLKRPAGITLPTVKIIDLKKEKNDLLLSEELLKAIKDKLEKKEQVILFQNRRGYSNFMQCKSCGELIKCPHCDVSLHYHSYTEEVICHYCGYKKPTPRKCPSCGGYSFMYGVGGTQKLEEQVRSCFPTAKVMRMDSDTTSKKSSYTDMFEAMSSNSVDILLGTQMISKGLDFPNVTLVGVILADISLGLADFRASERTFQLLTQVAGRSGRGDKVGQVIIQTYMPEHYAIVNSSNQDFLKMAEMELHMRESLFYPPHFRLARILFSHHTEKTLLESFNKNREFFQQLSSIYSFQELKVLGPAPAPIPRISNKFRYHLIFKGKDVSVISSVIKFFKSNYKAKSSIKVAIDIDPISLL